MLPLLLAASVADANPAPTASPLKTIITVKSTPLCQTLVNTVLPTLEGLKINDKIVASTKPQMIKLAKAWQTDSVTGHHFDQMETHQNFEPAEVHDNNDPAMLLPARNLSTLAAGLAHNLIAAQTLLANSQQFPNPPKTDADQQALQLKTQLDDVVKQQAQNLNVLNGLAETFALQDLLAQGDGTQGVLNEGGHYVSHNDQDVTFKDVTGDVAQGHPSSAVQPKNPTVDTDPAISQEALGQYANNPVMRFYVGVQQIQQTTAQSEDRVTAAVLQVENECAR